ncbi:GNAT family N-acetyltransferase [Hymenobacter sp. B81]|uniref:GNAT family N-acetyltransferase n=1 Tax=Hymenobacter sp. B81 TaxID=3344878 RepID=UPI0037DC954D
MPLLPVPPAAPLATPRLLLRPYGPADAPAFFALLDAERPRLQPAFPRRIAAVQTLTDAQQTLQGYAASWRQRRLLVWGIWAAQTQQYLGDISLQPDTPRAQTAEVGYYLAAAAEGRGYAREALRHLADYAFQQLGTQKLILRCRTENARSQRTAEAAGFQRLAQQVEPGVWQFEQSRPLELSEVKSFAERPSGPVPG